MGPRCPRLRSVSTACAAACPAPTMTMGSNIRREMMPRFDTFRVLVVVLGLFCAAHGRASDLPQATRKVVYEKTDSGYRLRVVEAAVPTPGPHQVLLHVRAVSLNRG